MRLIALACLFLVIIGCGGGGGGSQGNPGANHLPAISNLHYSPQSASLNSGGGAITVTATYDFTDSGKDVKSAVITTYDPAGAVLSTTAVDASSLSGLASGTAYGSAVVSTTTAGNFSFDIYLVDAANGVSNKLRGTFTVNITIQGTRIVTFHPITGQDVNRPVDLSSTPIAALVPNGSGGFTSTPGTGKADGTFAINLAPSGYYWLQVGSSYLWTNRTSLDLGYDAGGRPDAVLPSMTTPVVFNLANLSPWNSSYDDLLYSSSNTDDYNFGIEYDATANGPLNGDSALSSMTVDWNTTSFASPLNDSSKGDHPYLVHMVGAANALGSSQVAKQVFEPGAFVQVDGSTTTFNGTFAAVPQTSTLRLAMKASAFTPGVATMGSGAFLYDQWLYLSALKGASTYGTYASSGDLAVVHPSSPVTADFDLGDLACGNPYPPTWDKFVAAYSIYRSSYLLPGMSVPWRGTAMIYTETTAMPTAQNPLQPMVTPVQGPRIAGLDFLSAQVGVGLAPVLSWQAPAMGTPSVYELNLYRLGTYGNTTTSVLVATFRTQQAGLQLPAGVLLTGNTYVFRIRTIQQNKDMSAMPYRYTMPSGTADVLSGMMTP